MPPLPKASRRTLMLRYGSAYSAKVLYMSGAGVFGPDHATVPEPTTLYGAFKLAGDGAARPRNGNAPASH
jgi:hypothetical protein